MPNRSGFRLGFMAVKAANRDGKSNRILGFHGPLWVTFLPEKSAAAEGIWVELGTSREGVLWSSTAALESVVETLGTVQTLEVLVPVASRGIFRLKARP